MVAFEFTNIEDIYNNYEKVKTIIEKAYKEKGLVRLSYNKEEKQFVIYTMDATMKNLGHGLDETVLAQWDLTNVDNIDNLVEVVIDTFYEKAEEYLEYFGET